ncbi:uncharacterized protein LOC121757755 [Salvia splendens]|uniref:uncharacterized protein LOC121757755 n=1 Tax=Salvia splendens TaxID=180675 RepID=UPI001C266DCE|nr:uncharacterized protein LOC121757755 [Salvia splendens]
MADDEAVQPVDAKEPIELLILLEEILRNHRQNMLLVCMLISVAKSNSHKRKWGGRGIPEVMIDSIPAHVKQLDRLTRVSDRSCLDNLRMDRNTFGKLCRILRDRTGLIDQKFVTVEEQVAMFLSILAHHKKTRVVRHDFMRSSETVSKYTHMVLRGVLSLHELLLVKPEPVDDDCTESRWKWFKVGRVPQVIRGYYVMQSAVLSALKYPKVKHFVIHSIVTRAGLKLTFSWAFTFADCYYLCDNAYANSEGFITTYKGIRYHLKEWGNGTQAPQTPEELFNLKHSKARNVIERSFALLKMRWGILRSPSYYPIEVQTGLIIACFLLHNFIRTHMEVDPYEELLGVHYDDGYVSDHDDPVLATISTVAPTPMWSKKRDDLAAAMWAERNTV